MAELSVDQKPSETAFFAALRRALANKDYGDKKFGPDNLAAIFLPAYYRFFLRFAKIRTNAVKKLDGFFPGMTEYLIARTVYFDQKFVQALKSGTPQIVILGAGYDSRAWRFAGLNSGTTIFELDAAPTQNNKLACLKKAHVETPPTVKLLPIDFNKQSLKDVLAQGGFDAQQKTLFLWEGVSYYLETDAVAATLDLVGKYGHAETAIVFDYTVPLTEENINDFYGASAFSKTMKEAHGNEALLFSLTEEDLGPFLAQHGLKVVEHFNNEAIEENFLTDDKGVLIGKIIGHFRFVLAAKS